MDESERRIRGLTTTAVRETSQFDAAFRRLGTLAAGAFAFTQLNDLPQQILKVRGEFEQLSIAFTTMLRSGAKADALLGDLTNFAAETPFGLKDAAQGAKQLIAYGSTAKTVVDELRTLSNIAAGTGTQLGDLVYLYGTLRTQGRAYAVDIRQFAGRGIPIYEELGKVLKINTSEVNAFVEAGKVGFKEVEQALKNMASGTGLFAGLNEAQSKSLLGLKERLGEAYDRMLNDIGKKNQDLIAGVITGATEVADSYQTVIDTLTVVAASYGAYRAALLITNIAQLKSITVTEAQAIAQATAATSMSSLSVSQTRAAASTALLTRAQTSLSAAYLANPFVLLGTALAALITYIVVFRKEVQQVKDANQLLAESNKSLSDSYGKQKADLTTLVSVLQNHKVAESERLRAYEKLKEISPDILQGLDYEKAKVADLNTAVKEYLVSLEKRIRLEAGQGALTQAFNQDSQIDKELETARKTLQQKQKIADLEKKSGKSSGVKPYSLAGSTTPDAQREASVAQGIVNRLSEQKQKSLAVIADLKKGIEGIFTPKSKEAINAQIADLELTAKTITNKLSPAYKLVEDQLTELYKLRNQKPTAKSFEEVLSDANTAVALRSAKAFADTDNKLDALSKKVKSKIGEAVRGTNERSDLQKLEKEIERVQGKLTPAEKRAQAAADKIGPFGSITYWENIAKKAEEIIGKTPSTDTATLAKQSAIKLDAEQKAEAVRKTYAVKSFEEELDLKKSQYELYQRWVEAYGQASADSQFAKLKESGSSYLDYLNSQIAGLETKLKSGKLTDKETLNLDKLNDQKDVITGRKKSQVDQFQEGLEKARTSAANLADYLVILKQKQDDLPASPKTNDDFAIRKQLAQEIVKTEAELQARLQQFLTSYASSGEQQLAIQQDFAEKRVALDKRYQGNRGAEYKQALKVIDDAEKQALQDHQQRQLEETDEYKKTTKVILEEGRKRLKIEIDNQRGVVEAAKKKFGVNSEIYKRELEKLNNLTKQLTDSSLSGIEKYAAIVGAFGQALSGLDGVAGAAGSAMVSLATQIPLVAKALKSGTSDAEKYAMAIQATVSLITAVINNSAANRQKEAEATQSQIDQQTRYNLLLNEQLGLQSKQNENVFVHDFAGEIKDNLDKYADAQKKYQESLKKLEEGRAKAGLKNQIDAGGVLSSAGTGALIGTAIAPGIGTAIGGVIGAVVGLFSSNKKVDEFTKLLTEYPELIQKTSTGVSELNTGLAQTLIDTNRVDDATKGLLQSSIDWQKQMEAARETIKEVVKTLAGSFGDSLRDNLVNAFKEGTDAAQAFKTSVEDILESMVTNLLFAKLLKPYFDNLEKDLTNSLSPGGDGRFDDDYLKFYQEAAPGLQAFSQGLKDFVEQSKTSGFDVLKNPKDAAKTNSLRGDYQSLTEQTGGILAGQMNAQRVIMADSNQQIRLSLIELSQIRINTGRIKETNEVLDAMDAKLGKIALSVSKL